VFNGKIMGIKNIYERFVWFDNQVRAKKYTARVETVSHECDLAVLRVDDDAFFSGVQPLALGDLPRMGDKVAVYGFPKGGDELCITEGVVSRVEYQYYAHSRAYLLACQIDAAINPGSSGGPVVRDGKIVGVAFQSLRSGDNIGYMVPVPRIQHFLKTLSMENTMVYRVWPSRYRRWKIRASDPNIKWMQPRQGCW
jgi:S1-C subfamily serine protease